MYPVVIGNGRCLTKDTEICGYRVPKGVRYAIVNNPSCKKCINHTRLH